MDIRQIPKHRIAQLPNHFFGEQMPIGISQNISSSGTAYQLSTLGLSEWTMLWQVSVYAAMHVSGFMSVGLALGDQLPTSDAEFFALEPLLPGIVDIINNRSIMYFTWSLPAPTIFMRKIIHTAGRKLVMRVFNSSTANRQMSALIVVSSVPTEIPDDFIPANQNQADKTNELLLERNLKW